MNKNNSKTKKRKSSLGNPNEQKGIMITPERVVLYALGVGAIIGVFWVAKKYIDSVTDKVNQADKKPTTEFNQASISNPVLQPVKPTDSKTEQPVKPTEPTDEVVIPPITNDRFWGNVQAVRDEFPLLQGKGGLRVKALQNAYRKLGVIDPQTRSTIGNATGYFGDKTARMTVALLGKALVSEQEFIEILKKAKMSGLEGIGDEMNKPDSSHELQDIFSAIGLSL
jgi:hypothetical protein